MSIIQKNRQEVLDTILKTPGHVLLHGDRGIGKTTFATEVLPRHLDKSRLVYINLLGLTDFADLLDSLGLELNDLFGLNIEEPSLHIKKIIREYGPVTIILDEWESLLDDNGMIVVFRELSQMANVRFVLVGKHLLSDHPETINTSTLFTPVRLSHFTYDEIVELIENNKDIYIFKVTPFLTEEAKKKLWEITTGHGFFLHGYLVRLYCEYPGQIITEKEVMALSDTVKKSVRWID